MPVAKTPPVKCTGYLRMLNDAEEDYVLYYFELIEGVLSCFERETTLGSKIGCDMFGDPISLEGFVMQTPSPERILICEDAKPKEPGAEQQDDEYEETLMIQFEETDLRDYQKWVTAFKEHLAFINKIELPPEPPASKASTSAPPPPPKSVTAESNAEPIYPVNQGKYRYPDQTIDILRAQVRTAGKIPLEYIPLEELKQEISGLFEKAGSGTPYDEGRLDFLLMCMDQNPQHRIEKEEESRRWREDIREYANECLDIMRGYIPPHITVISAEKLEQEGLSKDLVKRLMTKRCLWLIRFTTYDISKLHIADLTSRYTYDGQNLDIVETAALFAVVPDKFTNDDAMGSKEKWRKGLETSLKSMYEQMKNNTLAKTKQRAIQYKGQTPSYTNMESYHSIQAIKGDPDSKRQSYIDLKRRSVDRTSNSKRRPLK